MVSNLTNMIYLISLYLMVLEPHQTATSRQKGKIDNWLSWLIVLYLSFLSEAVTGQEQHLSDLNRN